LAKCKILSGQIRDDIELPDEPIANYLEEKQHRQTLFRKCLKRNSTKGYEYLRGTELITASHEPVNLLWVYEGQRSFFNQIQLTSWSWL